jgi:predicted dehydrogenase
LRAITAEELGVVTAIPLPQKRDWRIGIVGFGGISSAHVPAYQEAGWSIIAVADPSEAAQARAGQALPQVQVYSDYRQLLEEASVDVVSVLTQPDLRLPVVEAAAKFGRPLLIEKPLANTLEEAQQIVEIGEEHALPIAVSQNYRWAGSNFFARQLIEQGYIGEVHFASIEIFGTQDRDLEGHEFYSQCSDFLTVQWNTHLADLLQFWTDAVPQRRWTVTRRSAGQRFKSDNLLVSVVDFGTGLTGHILHSELVRSGATGAMCRIDGSAGSIVFPMSGDYLEIYAAKLDGEAARFDLKPLHCCPLWRVRWVIYYCLSSSIANRW